MFTIEIIFAIPLAFVRRVERWRPRRRHRRGALQAARPAAGRGSLGRILVVLREDALAAAEALLELLRAKLQCRDALGLGLGHLERRLMTYKEMRASEIAGSCVCAVTVRSSRVRNRPAASTIGHKYICEARSLQNGT